MLGQRLRRWPNIEPTLDKCTMRKHKTFVQHLYNVSPTAWNVLCLQMS